MGRLFPGYLKLGVLGVWVTFKKAEMAKTLRNGLSMIKINPLNHHWRDFVIESGLALHQFQKKLLLNPEQTACHVALRKKMKEISSNQWVWLVQHIPRIV